MVLFPKQKPADFEAWLSQQSPVLASPGSPGFFLKYPDAWLTLE